MNENINNTFHFLSAEKDQITSGGTVKTVAKTRSVNYEKAIIFLLQKQALLKIQFVCPASDNLELNFVKVPLHSKHHITSS